jgi:hypothetical protein
VQAVGFTPLSGRVWQQSQHHVERVEHDALRMHPLGLRLQRRQHSTDVEITRLHQVGLGLRVEEKHLLLTQQVGEPQPKLSALVSMRWEVSSKATKMPGSLQSRAPWARNCKAMMVLPEPGPPTSKVVRPRGRPPPVISSKPAIPVGTLLDALATCADGLDLMRYSHVILLRISSFSDAGQSVRWFTKLQPPAPAGKSAQLTASKPIGWPTTA